MMMTFSGTADALADPVGASALTSISAGAALPLSCAKAGVARKAPAAAPANRSVRLVIVVPHEKWLQAQLAEGDTHDLAFVGWRCIRRTGLLCDVLKLAGPARGPKIS